MTFFFFQMPIPKIKHDWYQTETSVIVSILAKNTENVKVCCNERTVSKINVYKLHFMLMYKYFLYGKLFSSLV